jgi:hypothetical protein
MGFDISLGDRATKRETAISDTAKRMAIDPRSFPAKRLYDNVIRM